MMNTTSTFDIRNSVFNIFSHFITLPMALNGNSQALNPGYNSQISIIIKFSLIALYGNSLQLVTNKKLPHFVPELWYLINHNKKKSQQITKRYTWVTNKKLRPFALEQYYVANHNKKKK